MFHLFRCSSFEMAFHYKLSPLNNDLCHQIYLEGAAGIFKVCADVFPVFRGLTCIGLHIQLVRCFLFLGSAETTFDLI